MSKLADVLNSPERKSQVVRDCLAIIDAEVADKSGLSGMAIKTGYKAVKGIKPGFVEKVVHDLLPEFADAVDPVYQEAVAEGRPVQQHFVAHAGRVADDLLAITDGRAERSQNNLVKKTYGKLRGQAKKNVEAAVPRLGELVEKHTS
jgi:hypothetical protein